MVFFLIHLIPGDPVDIMLGDQAMPAQKELLRQQLGLNEPILKQYALFWQGLVTLDLGKSIYSGEPVLTRLKKRYPATIKLAVAAMIVAIVIALPLGILSAAWRGSIIDSMSMLIAMIGVSMPNFWLGPLLILYFAYHMNLFPISGMSSFASIVLPAITLGTALASILSRMTRSTILDVIHQQYIRVAKSKGLSPMIVYCKHALRNALLPVVTIVGLQFGALLAGAIITEKIFSWPGIGLEIVDAIHRRDYPMVQGCVLAIALSYVLINFLTDVFYAVVDPRIRLKS